MKHSKIYQHNSYSTLYGGFYKGTAKITDLLAHGDMGFGTLDGADGETIILDGVCYQGNSDGKTRVVKPDETTPYTCVFKHRKTLSDYLETDAHSSDLLSNIIDQLPNPNSFYTVKIDGFFIQIHLAAKPRQPEYYPRSYPDILSDQPTFTQEKLCGTIVGIYSPKIFHDLGGSGFHLHFIDDERKFSGHVLDFIAMEVNWEVGIVSKVVQQVNCEDKKFAKMKFV